MSAKLVVAGVLTRIVDGRQEVLICQRAASGPMPLKWEFPGGKVESDEDPRAALIRELREELEIEATLGRRLACVRHEYKDGFFVELHFYAVKDFVGTIKNVVFEDVRWESFARIAEFDFLEADVLFIRDLSNGRIQI